MSDEHKIPFFDDYGVTNGNLRKAYDELELYVCAGRPLIYIQSFDFAVVDSMVARIAEGVPDRKMKIVEFVEGQGGVCFHKKEPDDDLKQFKTLKSLLLHYVNSIGRWDYLQKTPKKIILLLKNIHKELEKDNEIQSLLRQLAHVSMRENGEAETKTFVYAIILSPQLFIPPPLERLMALVRLEAPNEFEIQEHVERTLKQLASPIILNNDAYERITSSLLGLSRVEIDQVLALVLADNKRLESREAQEAILAEKRQLIQKTGLLKIVKDEIDEQEIGGLDKLQKYLKDEAKIYEQLEIAEKHGVGIPKGILIVGMPGCGKTMTAKLAAKWFHAPLICLDIGRLMGQYVGQSEENLRRALEMVQSVAPCVLWIDELEKAFSGVVSGKGGGSEVTTRLFGHFLTWMQEKPGGVYVIATANRINLLPPELLRRGRFDEVFRVDFPSFEEQEAIFNVQLKRRRPNDTFDLSRVLKNERGEERKFCGADIATLVGNAFKKAFVKKGKDLGGKFDRKRQESKTIELNHKDIQDALIEEAKEMTPLRDVLKDDINEIAKVLNRYQFKPASSQQAEEYKIYVTLESLEHEMDEAKSKLKETARMLAFLSKQIENKKAEMEKENTKKAEQPANQKGK